MTRTIQQQDAAMFRLTTKDVWRALTKASFMVLSYVTPDGESRSCGVVYKAVGQRLYVATDAQSWKARHIGASGKVGVTVLVRRGGLLSLLAPIPPATISFHAAATVHPAQSPDMRPMLQQLSRLLPEEHRSSAAIIEIVPEGTFVTYGIGVSLMKMRDPAAAKARVPVAAEP